MKTISRPTPDEIYEQINALRQEDLDAAGEPDSPAYWQAAADRAERQRELWRDLAKACSGDTPDWARFAAFRTGDHYADLAEQYRQFVRQTEALRKRADA